MKIGIAYTVHNRNEIARRSIITCIDYIKNVWGTNFFLAIVDDASLNHFHTADYRFENNVGVAVAKNKCLELLYDANCTHFFLMDDDTYPVVNKWWEPYINSGLNHACWNLNRPLIGKHDAKQLLRNPPIDVPAYWEYETPNGCMLYCTKKVLDVVGGWNTDFNGYGWDHPEWSSRIFNAGLTPARFIDIPNSKGLFEMANCESSFSSHDRMQIPNNFKLYQQNYYSKEFKPFK